LDEDVDERYALIVDPFDAKGPDDGSFDPYAGVTVDVALDIAGDGPGDSAALLDCPLV
jgi:hypothetical protein